VSPATRSRTTPTTTPRRLRAVASDPPDGSITEKEHQMPQHMAGAAAPWYEIRAKAGAADTTEVLIYGDIGESWSGDTITASAFVRDLQAIISPMLSVRINSFGGSVSDGLAIYNALTRYPGAVTVDIDGMAVSIASLIAMAGSTVRMAENAQFMVHAPWGLFSGNSALLREHADLLDRFATSMASSYVRKSGKSTDEVMAMLKDGRDHWFSAAEALAAGFVDAITEPVEVMASARLPEQRFRSVPAAAAAFMASKEQSMPDLNPAATITAPTVAAPAAQPVAAAAAPAVYARSAPESSEIRAMFAAFRSTDGVQSMLEDVLVDSSITPEAASKRLLAHLGRDIAPARPAGSHPHIETLQDEGDKLRDAGTFSLMARSGMTVDASKLQGNPVRGFKLLDFARASLQRAGVRTDGMGQMEIVAAAFTTGTSDFPVLLENTMNKTLQGAYALATDTWSRFCGVGSVSDFRAANRYLVGSFSNLDLVSELAEFKNKSIPDGQKASITATTKGNIINLSRQAVINDDLGAFIGLAGMLGRAARRTIEADVYALLALNSGAGGFRFGTDITALTATASGKIDYIGCIYNATDTKWDVVAVTKGF
jgi:ATP-dependent protease ClpP protease subunit